MLTHNEVPPLVSSSPGISMDVRLNRWEGYRFVAGDGGWWGALTMPM